VYRLTGCPLGLGKITLAVPNGRSGQHDASTFARDSGVSLVLDPGNHQNLSQANQRRSAKTRRNNHR
ncbi:hypothetical protein, partial [Pseudomonas monteilii]|uniref:hypothetical protein n=1 Tax=Pseudomonas monteilii TaxID=76759 RepID=UPI001E56D8C5